MNESIDMGRNAEFATLALQYELNRRDFRRKLALFPAELRHCAILANSIIGAENAGRLPETPEDIIKESAEFVEKLLGLMDPSNDEAFGEVLTTCLIQTIRDELDSCCPNCAGFRDCLALDSEMVGPLFLRRVSGEETDELKTAIVCHIEAALQRTPYLEAGTAASCDRFSHQLSGTSIGEVFGRYSSICRQLHALYDIDCRRVQTEMIRLNMEFCKAEK